MKIAKMIQKYFSNLFISVMIEDDECKIKYEIIKNSKTTATKTNSFKLSSISLITSTSAEISSDP